MEFLLSEGRLHCGHRSRILRQARLSDEIFKDGGLSLVCPTYPVLSTQKSEFLN